MTEPQALLSHGADASGGKPAPQMAPSHQTGVVTTPDETGNALNEIAFDIEMHESGAREVIPFVDGDRFRDIVTRFEEAAGYSTPGSYAGIVPDHFRFGPLVDHFMGNGNWNPGAPAVLGCDCLEWGCWPFHAVLEVTDGRVRWTSFLGPKADRDYGELGPFEFDRAQYGAALAELATALESSDD